MTGRWRSISLLVALTVCCGCQPLGDKVALPPVAPPPETGAPAAEGVADVAPREDPFAPGSYSAEEIAGEIARLEKVTNHPLATEAEKGEAMRRLALLYLASQNATRNMGLAAEAQSGYLALRPAEPARQEGEIWLALIQEGLASEQLMQQQLKKIGEKERALDELVAEKQRLAVQLASLEAVNAKLKTDIEKLKFIDISVEQKRKSIR